MQKMLCILYELPLCTIRYNKETVELTMVEQPELIGGFVLKVGDIEEDNSIRGRLNRLEKKLTWR